LGDGDFANDRQAHNFIQQYIEAMGIGPLLSQPMTVGYARRMAGNPFDSHAIQTTGIRGWMMLYTVEGMGTLDTGVRQLEMKVGNAALFEPGSVFSYYRAASCDCWGHYWVAFHAAENWRAWLNWPRVGPNVGFLADSSDHTEIEDSLKLLLKNYISPSPMAADLNHNLLEQVILRCRNISPGTGPASIDPRVAKAQVYITENFNQAFSIETVANAANLSLSGLAHLFKQQTGMTVLQWRDEKRMMHAIWLLRTSNKPIGVIAAESGFEETPFFNRTFKRLIGCTPGQYRLR
jgi:AraC family transcriptional regulator, arabinose operon regulatory protein